MCGRYRLTAADRIRERLGLDDPDVDVGPRYNIAPSQQVPTVRQEELDHPAPESSH
jgi:putative SOS response-associated peptidase YedK